MIAQCVTWSQRALTSGVVSGTPLPRYVTRPVLVAFAPPVQRARRSAGQAHHQCYWV